MSENVDQSELLFSNSVYDQVKKFSLYILPAIGAAYFSLALIWGLPRAEEVVGTIAVVETLMGVALRVSTSQYDKLPAGVDGTIVITQDEENEGFSNLNVRIDPESLLDYDKQTLTIQVERP